MEAFSASEKSIAAVRTDPLATALFNMHESLPALAKKIPTTFIWGENDIFAAPSHGKEIEALVPDIKFHWVKNAGHQVQTDQPEIVAEIVDNFIKANAAR
jgi:pimeloyl-ACP methyl ester carboxylesterase